jgi:hypothetical protein
MLAHAFLTVMTAAERAAEPTCEGLMPIPVKEPRRLLVGQLLRPNRSHERLHQWSIHLWSVWRRRHHATARAYHYRRRHESSKPALTSLTGRPPGA